MGLPDKDHPVWKTVQLVAVVIGFGIYVVHLHAGGRIDVGDATGAAAGGVGLKLAVQYVVKIFSDS